jgi:hypothetical protein
LPHLFQIQNSRPTKSFCWSDEAVLKQTDVLIVAGNQSGAVMRIEVPGMNSGASSRWGETFDVVDTDSGKIVGSVLCSDGLRTISLFDGKYKGHFHEDRECQAFARGVETVLNQTMHQSNVRRISERANIRRGILG